MIICERSHFKMHTLDLGASHRQCKQRSHLPPLPESLDFRRLQWDRKIRIRTRMILWIAIPAIRLTLRIGVWTVCLEWTLQIVVGPLIMTVALTVALTMVSWLQLSYLPAHPH